MIIHVRDGMRRLCISYLYDSSTWAYSSSLWCQLSILNSGFFALAMARKERGDAQFGEPRIDTDDAMSARESLGNRR